MGHGAKSMEYEFLGVKMKQRFLDINMFRGKKMRKGTNPRKRRNREKCRSYYGKSIIRFCRYYVPKSHRVLEIGCGTGELLAGLDAAEKTGIDFCPAMVEEARRRYPGIRFEEMAAERLEFEETFDTIILSNLVGVVRDVDLVVSQLYNVIHPGSRIILTTYSHLWEPIIRVAEWLRLKKATPVQNWLSVRDLVNILSLHDFETYRCANDLLLPVGIPLLSSFFNQFLGRLPIFRSLCVNRYLFARQSPVQQVDQQEYSTSIIIPVRNEAGNIEAAVRRIPWFGKHVEIIIVEGHSTDSTLSTMMKVRDKYVGVHDVKLLIQPGTGKGDAVRKGFSFAKGDVLMILDADLTVPPEELPRFYEALKSRKGEFINGVRLVYPMEKKAMRPLNTFGNHFFGILFSWLLEQPIKDTLCGTKVLFRKDYEELERNRSYFGDFDPFGDFDLLFGAHKLNLKMIDLPVHYKERKYGNTNIRRFRHGFLLLKMCGFAAMRIKFRR